MGVQLRAEDGDEDEETVEERVRSEECVGRIEAVPEREAEIDRVAVELAETDFDEPPERVDVEVPEEEREAFAEAEEETVDVALPLPFELGVELREEVTVLDTLALDVPVRVLVMVLDSTEELVGDLEGAVERVDVREISEERLGCDVCVIAADACAERVEVAVRVDVRLAVAVRVGRMASTRSVRPFASIPMENWVGGSEPAVA